LLNQLGYHSRITLRSGQLLYLFGQRLAFALLMLPSRLTSSVRRFAPLTLNE
jgi:hypothetical protein